MGIVVNVDSLGFVNSNLNFELEKKSIFHLFFNSGTEREEVGTMGVRRRKRMRSAAHPGNIKDYVMHDDVMVLT